jgi:hypothetical protein
MCVKSVKTHTERAMTMDILTHDESEVWFPLCCQTALVRRVRSFESDLEPFEQAALNELRHIIAEMSSQADREWSRARRSANA